MSDNSMEVHSRKAEPWKITLVDTGETTLTGGRLRRVRDHIGDESFCFTYGDGVADLNIQALISFHKKEGRKGTLQPFNLQDALDRLLLNAARCCLLKKNPKVTAAGLTVDFFVLDPSVIDLVDSDQCTWEQQPLQTLAKNGDLSAYHHRGFWQPMDTLRDKNFLEELWQQNKAPWKLWI